ncbi:hypothetical protein BDZ91DRAFT_763437 [Kalaharituber pfeilii]|nr:hypothetical protein BDZ91DRAFT_763437 [Kalaharituber pfeilii]
MRMLYRSCVRERSELKNIILLYRLKSGLALASILFPRMNIPVLLAETIITLSTSLVNPLVAGVEPSLGANMASTWEVPRRHCAKVGEDKSDNNEDSLLELDSYLRRSTERDIGQLTILRRVLRCINYALTQLPLSPHTNAARCDILNIL